MLLRTAKPTHRNLRFLSASISAASRPVALTRFATRPRAAAFGSPRKHVVHRDVVRRELGANVFAQLATAPRIEFETPSPLIGCLTEVDTMLMIRPRPAAASPESSPGPAAGCRPGDCRTRRERGRAPPRRSGGGGPGVCSQQESIGPVRPITRRPSANQGRIGEIDFDREVLWFAMRRGKAARRGAPSRPRFPGREDHRCAGLRERVAEARPIPECFRTPTRVGREEHPGS